MKKVLAFFLGMYALSTWAHYPYLFIENKGQWEQDFHFKVDIPGGVLFLEENAFVYHFADLSAVHALHTTGKQAQGPIPIKGHVIRMEMLGTEGVDFYEPSEFVSFYHNYYYGNNPQKWVTQLYPAQRMEGKALWPGVNIVWYAAEDKLKYDLVVEKGARADKIRFAIQGAERVRIQNEQLEILTTLGTIVEDKPYAYQWINGQKVEVPCQYKLVDNELRYHFPKGYNPNFELVIDPSLIFGSFSGSTTDNWGYTATFDGNGNLYSGGIANGIGYPTTVGAYQTTWNGGHGFTFPSDVTISKFNSNGTSLIYSTYLGGVGSELPHSLIVNNYDELFVFGTTGSNNFPVTANAYDNTFNAGNNTTTTMNIDYLQGSDIYVTKFNVTGTALVASTYIGGTGNDGLNLAAPLRFNYADEVRGEIIVDNNNNIYVASTTLSTDFPTTSGAFQPNHAGGSQDGIVFKMDNSLSTLLWSSYLGGAGNDAIYSLDLYPNDDVIASGGTASNNFPTTENVFNSFSGGGVDGFVTKITANGSTILNSIYVGSPAYDQTYMVELDDTNDIFVLGQTSQGGTFWIQNATYSVPNSGQFIRKFTSNFQAIDFSTAFGRGDGNPDISPSAFLVDVCNKIYVSGWGGAVNSFAGSSTSGMPITGNAYQSTTDGSDYYLFVMEDNASAFVYGSFYGGPFSPEHVDGGTSRFNRNGEIYQSVCAGCGANSDFPTTPGAVSTVNNSPNCNNGVFKFDFQFPATFANFQLPPSTCVPGAVNFQNTSTGATAYLWKFGDGDTSTAVNPSHVYTQPGAYTITLIAFDLTGQNCNPADSVKKQILILSDTTSTLSPVDVCVGQPLEIGIPPNGDPSLTYTWSPAQGLSNANVSNPIATPANTTNYQLLVSNGVCTDTLLQTVNVLNLPNLSNQSFTVCNGDSVQIGAVIPGATLIQWSPTTGLSSPTSAQTFAKPTVNTVYTLVYGNSQCSDSVQYTFTVVNGLASTLNPISLCPGDSVQISGIDTTGRNQFQWIPATGISNPTIPDPFTFPTQTTPYQFLMSNGVCTDTVNLLVSVLNPPVLPVQTHEICIGSSVTIGIPNPNPAYTYQWSPAAGLSSTTVSNPIASPVVSTTYVLNVNLTGSPTLCNRTDSVRVQVQTDVPLAAFTIDSTLTCDGFSLTVTSTAQNADTVFWFIDGQQVVLSQVLPLTVLFDSSVVIQQVAINGLCTDTATLNFEAGPPNNSFIVVMPNVFTPFSSNGLNDAYCPIGFGNQYCYEMVIYNRWGTKVFESSSAVPCWNGVIQDTSQPASDGVYYYVIRYNGGEQAGALHIINP